MFIQCAYNYPINCNVILLNLGFKSYKFLGFQGMDLYFKRHDGQVVTCEDFFVAMRDANDADFANFYSFCIN